MTIHAKTLIRMPEPLFEKIKTIAEKEHRSCNGEIVYILEKYVNEFENKYGSVTIDEAQQYYNCTPDRRNQEA